MEPAKEPIWTKDFLSISFVNMSVFITFYSLMTTLPIFVIYQLDGTEAQGGLVVTIMLLSAILIRPFSGNIIQRFGKRKILIVSTIAFAVTSLGYMMFDQFMSLMVLRFIHGLSFGLMTTVSSAIAADIVPNERKGEGLGYFTMFMNVAVVIGPFVGLTLIQMASFQLLFIVLNIVVLISVICAFLVKIPNTGDQNVKADEKRKVSIHDFFEVKVLPIALISALIAFSYSGVISFISVYAKEMGLEKVSGYFFLVFSITMLATRPYLGRLFDRRGPKIVILPCLLIFAGGYLLLSISHSPILFLVSAGIIGVGYGSLLPFLLSMSVQSVERNRNGHATATFFTLFDIGIAAGSFTLGIVVHYTGFSNLYIYLAGIIIMTTVIFFLYHNHIESIKNEPLSTTRSL
ncbi:MFS transporter [Cytobacillus sp. FJAT-54145]|uniref:MFS transporter n=1 Tax=Cytobacillus spartinae TaxID=3299023 RepID=A0ABW6K816_9BACI